MAAKLVLEHRPGGARLIRDEYITIVPGPGVRLYRPLPRLARAPWQAGREDRGDRGAAEGRPGVNGKPHQGRRPGGRTRTMPTPDEVAAGRGGAGWVDSIRPRTRPCSRS